MREPLKINQMINREVTQFYVQGDLIIPDVKPDIVRVLYVDSDVVINSKEVLQDRVIIEGVVNFEIIYLSKDPDKPVRGLSAGLNFKEPIDLLGARHGMEVSIKRSILNTDIDILNERKLFVKAIIEVDTRISNPIEIDLITGTQGTEDIQMLRDVVRVCHYIGQNTDKCVIKEEIELPVDKPPIFEILKTGVRISKEIKVSDNKLMIKGYIYTTTIYGCEDEENSIQTVENEIPFSQILDIVGLHEGVLCDVDIIVNSVSVKPADNEEGEARILNYEIEMEISAKGFKWEENEIVTDMYSPGYKMELVTKEIKTDQMVNQTEDQIIIRDLLNIPAISEATQIYSVLCSCPCISSMKIVEDKVMVEGTVDVWILYRTGEENNIMSYREEMPFNHVVDIRGAGAEMLAQVKLDVERCGGTILSKNEVEVKIILVVDIKLYMEGILIIINNIKHMQIEEEFGKQPSIIIYYVQPGDTLWKISKKFHTTIEDLVKLNDISNHDMIFPGQQILIQKRLLNEELVRR